MKEETDEAARAAALADYRLLDTPPDPRLDALVADAAALFDTPMATLTLIDRDRQWFKARRGLAAAETPLRDSICAHVVRASDVLVVEDASADPRFADMAGVAGEPHIRFYAGAPLTLRSGVRVGTLCVLGDRPRGDFDEVDRALLAQLAARAVAEFETERDLREEGAAAPADEDEWLYRATSLLGRASVALERCGATAALARLEEVMAEVDELTRTELV